MQIADLNIPNEIINLEIQLGQIRRALEYVLNNNTSLAKPSVADMDRYLKQAQDDVQKKYPQLGITFNR